MVETTAYASKMRGVEGGYSEGNLAKMIEEQTVKVPSDVFLMAAGASIVASLACQAAGKDRQAVFIGQWAPTLLILGLYNKIVKLNGSER